MKTLPQKLYWQFRKKSFGTQIVGCGNINEIVILKTYFESHTFLWLKA